MKKWICLLIGLATSGVMAQSNAPSARAAFENRIPLMRRQIPEILRAAGRGAESKLAHTNAWVTMPSQGQKAFTSEMISRAGGLASAWIVDERRKQPRQEPDSVLVAVRSWEEQDADLPARLQAYRTNGWIVTVFASAAGKPADLPCDFFIDNGAPSPSREYGRVNIMANITLGWLWCCEYGAALSRKGCFPAILYSVGIPGAKEYNRPFQTPGGRAALLPCDKAVPAGELAEAYLKRVGALVADCRSPRIQAQVTRTAEAVAARLNAGGTVGIAGMGHAIVEEVAVDCRTPWKTVLRGSGRRKSKNPFRDNLKPGDWLIWIAYLGLNSAWTDYGTQIREAGVELVTSYAPDPEWTKDIPPVKGHIDQCWKLPDADVAIPVYPHAMGPVSGINALLVLRMLDEETAARLNAEKGAHP